METEGETLFTPYISSSKPIESYNGKYNDFTIGPTIPDYLAVDNKDPVRQWKIKHEHEMFDQLITSQKNLREKQHSFKLEIVKLLRKVPIDLITKEFLNKDKLTIDARAYIIDKVIPVVVLGLEKLLIEADKRGLIEKEIDYNFNPINFLAQYLMRNNPAFSNFNEASPYVRGLRQVVQELKVEIFHLSDNKLARIKASAKSKREEREKEEERKKQEAKRRIEIYQKLFDQFLIDNQSKVDYETVHLSIKSFSEIVHKFPEEMKNKLVPILKMQYTEEKEKKLGRKDFGLLISHYADDMPLDIFDHFADHLSKCAKLYRSSMEKETRKKMLSELFMTCDLEEMGLLDRQRILMLFDQFYEKVPENIKAMLRDPRHWPISDYNKDIPVVNVDQNSNQSHHFELIDDNINNENIDIENNNEIINEINENQEQNINSSGIVNTESKSELKEISEPEKSSLELETKISIADLIDRVEKSLEKEDEDEIKMEEFPEENNDNQDLQAVKNLDIGDVELSRDKSVTDDVKVTSQLDNIIDEKVDEIIKPERHVTIVEDLNETLHDLDDIETHSVTDIDEDDTFSERVDDKLQREITKLSVATHSTAYDEENINFPQFFQVTEEFLGDIPVLEVLEDLIEFIREGYKETPAERLKRLQKARRVVQSAQRRQLIDELFNTWDNDNAGSVNMKEIADTIGKYKNGTLVPGIKVAKKEARMNQHRRVKETRLNRKEFRTFIHTVAKESEMLENENETETMISYFIGLVQRTYAEKLRGEARRKWLSSILWAAEISCGSIDGVYRAVFQAMYKDAEQHGDCKKISCSIALLENNSISTEIRGQYLLHFMVSTSDQTEYVVGKVLDRSSQSIYFQAIYSGNVIHLIHASLGQNVIYWNPDITEAAKEGTMAIVPIKDDIDRVFGIMVVDTFNDPFPEKTSFYSHEIFFYQGLSKQFSTAFHHVEMLRRLKKVCESAISWICRRILSVKGADLYLREKHDQKSVNEFVLRHILSASEKGEIFFKQKIPRIEKSDNLFKTYLFDTVETSQSITTDAYGEKHIAIPLRDLNGIALAVIDINIGGLKFLPSAENTEIARMMSLLQQAFNEIIKISQLSDDRLEESNNKNENPEITTRLIAASGVSDAETIFDQLILADLRANIAKLDAQAYAEIRSYKDPPITIHAIIQALLALLYPKEAESGLFKNWEKCKKYISTTLGKLILSFDPFGDISTIPIDILTEAMLKVPHSEIDKHSSKPALDLYNWVFCCITLIQHRAKMIDSTH